MTSRRQRESVQLPKPPAWVNQADWDAAADPRVGEIVAKRLEGKSEDRSREWWEPLYAVVRWVGGLILAIVKNIAYLAGFGLGTIIQAILYLGGLIVAFGMLGAIFIFLAWLFGAGA